MHPMERYRIPKAETRVEIDVSNSRFITTVAHTESVQEARTTIKRIRDEMPDATHHVYAYKIGYGASVTEGLSDDGEPSGTAGPPAMAVLRGSGLGDVTIVITRYFGGTKLGTGGLVSAYTKAAQLAFKSLETEEKIEKCTLFFHCPYPLYEQTKRLLASHDARIDEESFETDVALQCTLPEENAAPLTQQLSDLSAGAISPRHL